MDHEWMPAPRTYTGTPVDGDARWICRHCGQRVGPYKTPCARAKSLSPAPITTAQRSQLDRDLGIDVWQAQRAGIDLGILTPD